MPLGLSEIVEKAISNAEAISAQAVRAGLDSGEVDLVVVCASRASGARGMPQARSMCHGACSSCGRTPSRLLRILS